jgi:hypothetical protein
MGVHRPQRGLGLVRVITAGNVYDGNAEPVGWSQWQ